MKKKSNKLNILKGCPWCGKTPDMNQGWSGYVHMGRMLNPYGVSITCNYKKCKLHPQLSAVMDIGVCKDMSKAINLLKKEVIETWNKRVKC
jgi:hypothetical protein